MCPVLLWMHQFECFKNTLKTNKCDLGDYECSNVSALRNHLPFYRIQVFPLSGLWTPASPTHYVKRALWNFADVTLADDDNNSMLSEGDSKAFWGSDGHNLDGDRATGWRGDRCTSRARSLARWCRSFMETLSALSVIWRGPCEYSILEIFCPTRTRLGPNTTRTE